MARLLPDRYHAHMRFRAVSGPMAGFAGEIISIDFSTWKIALRPENGNDIEFPVRRLTLIDHDTCDCGVTVQEVA